MTLAQLKAEAILEEGGDRGVAGSFMDGCKKIFNRLFGPDERPPPPPMHEIGSNDLNIVTANRSASGGAVDQLGCGCNQMGGDPWMRQLPNMGPMMGMFPETDANVHSEADTEAEAEADADSDSDSEVDVDEDTEAKKEGGDKKESEEKKDKPCTCGKMTA